MPGSSEGDKLDHWSGAKSPAEGGRWHLPWGPQVQADWADVFYQLALSKPFVETVAWLNMTDGLSHYLSRGSLCSDNFSPKPVYEHIRQLKGSMSPPRKGKAPAAPRTRPAMVQLPRKHDKIRANSARPGGPG